MSRVINPDVPLSEEDREWLNNNGRENEARAHDARLGVEGPPPNFITGGEPSLATGFPASSLAATPGISPVQVAMALGDKERLLDSCTEEELQAALDRKQEAKDQAEDAGAEDQSRAATEVVREGDDGVPDYEDWKADNLRAQLGVRELNKSGNKAELVERLRDDDEND